MQALKKPGDGFGPVSAQEEIKIKPFKPVFDPHESMQMAGAEDVSQEEQEKQAQEAARRGKQTRLLCCCRSPGCGIGPFTEIEEY